MEVGTWVEAWSEEIRRLCVSIEEVSEVPKVGKRILLGEAEGGGDGRPLRLLLVSRTLTAGGFLELEVLDVDWRFGWEAKVEL